LLSHTAAYEQNGDRLGRYRLIAVLARGGMGDVYLATTDGVAGFSKLLVVKELRAEQADDDVYVNMFMDEARLAARLSHPNIVQTIEVGSDGPRRFLVMEYLDGQPLHRVLRRAGRDGYPLTVGVRVRVLADVLEALAYAHTLAEFDGTPLGIVHRDVSPQNVFLTYDGQVKLIDFGIAKTSLSSQQTTAGVLKGKVRYMAPEQSRGQAVDARSDVFSCGVVLWELLLGRGPWEGQTEFQVLDGLMRASIPRLYPSTDLPQDVSPDLAAVIQRATSPAPADRYPTARAMRDALLASLPPIDRDNHNEELREVVASLFAEERRELRAVVDTQLRGISSQASLNVVSLTRVRADESISSSARRPRMADESFHGSMPSGAAGAGPEIVITSISQRPRATGFRRGTIAILAAAVLVASAAIAWAVTRRAPEPPPNDAKALPAPPPAPSQTGAVDGPSAVHVTVRASPAASKVYVDGVPVGNPYDARIPRDNVIHALVVEAPGYLTKTRGFSSAADSEIEIALDRDPVRYGAMRGSVEAPAHASPVSPANTPSTAKAASSASPDAPVVRAHRHRQVDKEDPYAQ
jgi:serine/threonine protein kinase